MTPPIMPTRILIVGSGGREHALAWKLAHEPGVNDVYVAPGSDGMAVEPRVTVVPGVDPLDAGALAGIARAHAVELIVIGPEAPLAAGVADELRAAGLTVFGPSRAGARIESSKWYAHEVADAASVPMAAARRFVAADGSGGVAHVAGLLRMGRGAVVKADGLAAGKGVTVCETVSDAERAVAGIDGPFLVEERLYGPEASVIAICDGERAVALPAARDHKRLHDGDRGPNTGGMGAYSPVPDLPDPDVEAIVERFHRPVLRELARRGTPFRGALYAGLMLTADGPRLLEFNARFGDPETQVLLPRLGSALGPLLLAAARGSLREDLSIATFPDAALGIVLAAEGYPGTPRRGDAIAGLDEARATGALVFHAGTRLDADGTWRTDGGRVLSVVGRGVDLAAARRAADEAAAVIRFAGSQRRHDIGVVPAGAAA